MRHSLVVLANLTKPFAWMSRLDERSEPLPTATIKTLICRRLLPTLDVGGNASCFLFPYRTERAITTLTLTIMLWSRRLLACSLLPSVLGLQTVLGTNRTISTDADTSAYDDGFFTPFESLSSLSHAEFTTLQHPLYPRHSVRIKKSDFCDGTVGCVTRRT